MYVCIIRLRTVQVFEKAHRYASKSRDQLVTVVLDEVGLAEVSAHNPLKVLHTLLEPEEAEVAVVGISNWALDAGGRGQCLYGWSRHALYIGLI